MPPPRKIAIFSQLKALTKDSAYRIWQPGNPNTFVANPEVMADATGVTDETAARVAADAALSTQISNETAARITADNTEASARSGADTTLQTNINNEASARSSQDTTLQTNINNEATARASGDTAAHFASLDLSGLPTSNPGSGRPWLSSGNIRVGP